MPYEKQICSEAWPRSNWKVCQTWSRPVVCKALKWSYEQLDSELHPRKALWVCTSHIEHNRASKHLTYSRTGVPYRLLGIGRKVYRDLYLRVRQCSRVALKFQNRQSWVYYRAWLAHSTFLSLYEVLYSHEYATGLESAGQTNPESELVESISHFA